MSSTQITPIGIYNSIYNDKVGLPRLEGHVKGATGFITLSCEDAESHLEGLIEFPYIWVMFWDESASKNGNVVDSDGRKKGAFATRTFARPNPIGMVLMQLEAIKGRNVYVSGKGVPNQTTVIDIKPYIEEFDSKEVMGLGWADDIEATTVPVEFTKVALDQVDHYFTDNYEKERFINMIAGIIEQDPRPPQYRKKKYTGFIHGMSVGDQSIQFCFDGSKFIIENIEPA